MKSKNVSLTTLHRRADIAWRRYLDAQMEEQPADVQAALLREADAATNAICDASPNLRRPGGYDERKAAA